MKPEIKETDYIKAWSLFWLCATVAGLICGAVIGAILGAAMGAAGVPIPTIQVVCGIAGFLVSIPISYLFFRIFVSRFIVQKLNALVPDAGNQPTTFAQS